MEYCKFTQCNRCDMYYHDCQNDMSRLCLSGSMYCFYCDSCQICGCCPCGKPGCEEEHI